MPSQCTYTNSLSSSTICAGITGYRDALSKWKGVSVAVRPSSVQMQIASVAGFRIRGADKVSVAAQSVEKGKLNGRRYEGKGMAS